MTLGSLFAGIGGIDLGFERAGFRTVWQVEKNAYCRQVLRKNFPYADRRVTDVRFAGARNLKPVDVIAGGFPCQDISNAGKRAGIDGERSGLWREMHRIIGELRPRFVLVENVAALLGRGISRVCGDLAEIGYDAEWQIISAADVGAPHLRERIWILAYPMRSRQQGYISRPGIFKPTETAFPEHRNAGFDDWKGLDDFAASLPEVNGLSVGLVRKCVAALGNSVVPQIPELIARRIAENL